MAKKPQHAQNNQRSQQGKQGQQQKRGGKAQGGHATHTPAAPVRPWRPGRDKFLPVSRSDMDARGWDQCDFVYICGDAYVDHPSFGMAIISRVLDAHGYKVGIICQPDWTDPASITVLGEPRLGFLVSAGNMDSMVNHYSVTKHRRHTDAILPVARRGTAPIVPSRSTATSSARRSRTFPSSSAASRQACAVWPTTTTGRTSSSVRCCSTRAPTSSSTAWASTRLSRSPTRSTRDCPSTRSPISTAPSTARVRSTSLRLRPAAQLGRPCRRQAQLRAQL